MPSIYPTECDSEYLAKIGVDILEQVQNRIMKYSKLGHVVLTGDLNAHTGSESDFIHGDNDKLPVDMHYIADKQI